MVGTRMCWLNSSNVANQVKWSRVGSELLETTPVLLKRNPGLFSKYFKLTDNPVGRKKSLIVRNTWKHSVDEQLSAWWAPAPSDSCPNIPPFGKNYN